MPSISRKPIVAKQYIFYQIKSHQTCIVVQAKHITIVNIQRQQGRSLGQQSLLFAGLVKLYMLASLLCRNFVISDKYPRAQGRGQWFISQLCELVTFGTEVKTLDKSPALGSALKIGLEYLLFYYEKSSTIECTIAPSNDNEAIRFTICFDSDIYRNTGTGDKWHLSILVFWFTQWNLFITLFLQIFQINSVAASDWTIEIVTLVNPSSMHLLMSTRNDERRLIQMLFINY